MRSRLNLNDSEDEANIDMTPMLDVVFIMLIFFIVSTTFVRDEGVTINRPSASTAQVQKSQGLVVAIDSVGQIWLDQARIERDQLQSALLAKLAQENATSALIKADESADTGVLIEVLDLIKSAGITQVAVATQSLK